MNTSRWRGPGGRQHRAGGCHLTAVDNDNDNNNNNINDKNNKENKFNINNNNHYYNNVNNNNDSIGLAFVWLTVL